MDISNLLISIKALKRAYCKVSIFDYKKNMRNQLMDLRFKLVQKLVNINTITVTKSYISIDPFIFTNTELINLLELFDRMTNAEKQALRQHLANPKLIENADEKHD